MIFEHLFILKIHNESTIIQNPKGKRKKWSFIVRKKNPDICEFINSIAISILFNQFLKQQFDLSFTPISNLFAKKEKSSNIK